MFGRRQSTLTFQVTPAQANALATLQSAAAATTHAPPPNASSVRAAAALQHLPPHSPVASRPRVPGLAAYSQPVRSSEGGAADREEEEEEEVGADIRDLMKEMCVMLVCQRCQQGIVEKFLDSCSADFIRGLVEQHATFGQRRHTQVRLWFKGQEMQAMGTLKDYSVKAEDVIVVRSGGGSCFDPGLLQGYDEAAVQEAGEGRDRQQAMGGHRVASVCVMLLLGLLAAMQRLLLYTVQVCSTWKTPKP